MQVHRHEAALRARGADVVFVGSGDPRGAKAFRKRLGLDVRVYAAPPGTYHALGMRRSVVGTVRSGRLLVRFARAMLRRRAPSGAATCSVPRAGGAPGDRWQLGGVLVVRPGGEVAYEYLSRKAGDHPPVAAIVGSIARAA